MTTTPEPDSRRVAVVTGGAGAIGSAITDALQGNGHRTVVPDRIGEVVCDLSSEASTRAAGATVLERFGRVIVIISDTFWSPPPVLLPYVASKGALLGIVRSLAVGLGPAGIAVSAVAPGLTDTPAARTVNTDEQFDATVERQALRRRLTPEDTAAAVAFLASDGAAAMTGQVLCADGGLVLR